MKTHTAGKTRKELASARWQQNNICNIFIITGGTLALIAIIGLLLTANPTQNGVPPRMGSPLGEFALTDINGKTVRLSDYQGKPVLINP